MPTYWSFSDQGGLSHSVVGIGTDSGVDYIDIRIFGTTTSAFTNSSFLNFDGNQIIAAANGQSWTQSIFTKIAAGSMTNISGLLQAIAATNSSGGFTEWVIGGASFTPTAALTRVSASGNTTNAADAYLIPGLLMSANSGLAIDITLRLGWPQLEQSATASPPQRTVAGTVGVNTPAEIVTLTTPPAFGSAYSMYGAGSTGSSATSSAQILMNVNDGSANNRVFLGRYPGNAIGYSISAGVTISLGNLAWVANNPGKVALAVAASDQAFVFNGGGLATGAGALPINVSIGKIGSNEAGAQQWDGDITEFAIWPTTRIPNASLISGTQ
jgi:hypothetical protein